MNRLVKSFIPFLPIVLLASCTAHFDENKVIEEFKGDLAQLTYKAYSKVDAKIDGHVVTFDQFYGIDKVVVPTGKRITNLNDDGSIKDYKNDYGASFISRVPILITSETALPKDDSEDYSSYSYGRISSVLQDSGDPQHHIQYSYDNSNMIFSINRINKKLKFYHVRINDNSEDINEPTEVTARFYIKLQYNKEGYLSDEIIKTSDTSSGDPNSVDIHVQYTYSN